VYVDGNKPTQFPKPDFRFTLAELPDGEAGVRATLKIMSAIKNAYKKLPTTRNLALSIVRDLPQKSFVRQIHLLHEYVRDRISYVRDVAGVETVQTPDVTLHLRAGDCDDKAVLLASLLESIGHPTRFVAIGVSPDRFSHVFVETRVGQKWMSLDPTEPYSAGWRPPRIAKAMRIG
jgi:transglutaminase-like putative cysteine protease